MWHAAPPHRGALNAVMHATLAYTTAHLSTTYLYRLTTLGAITKWMHGAVLRQEDISMHDNTISDPPDAETFPPIAQQNVAGTSYFVFLHVSALQVPATGLPQAS